MEEIRLFLTDHNNLVLILRIVLASICGGVIGVERTLRQKDAGFRTHIIVALGSALMMAVSKYGFFDMAQYGITADATRVASNIITGISFLGAGMIFIKGLNIKGLTTAAGIWVTAAIGMAIGAGMYEIGLVSVAILLLVQIVFHKFLIGFDKVLANDNVIQCFLQIENTAGAVAEMKSFLSDNSIHIADSVIETEDDNMLLTIHLNVQCGNNVNIDDALAQYLTSANVRQAFAL